MRRWSRVVIEPDWPAPPGVRAISTERAGGVSIGPYRSLNLACHVGDEPGAVAANRDALVSSLNLTTQPCWLEQVHGPDVLDLDTEPPGRADGGVTSTLGRVCVVLTADCVPVLLAARDGTRVGAAHAGWRGLAAGVLPAAVARMGTSPAQLQAWLGPAIGPTSYEVDAGVRDAFVGSDPGVAACFAPTRPGHWHADLYGLARASLAQAGVEAVYGGDFCTFAESERFFSHRREAPCGRMATLIWRTA
jgi:YfiH family protein